MTSINVQTSGKKEKNHAIIFQGGTANANTKVEHH